MIQRKPVPYTPRRPGLTEAVIDGRKVSIGWPVHVLPSQPNKRDGFDALVKKLMPDKSGQLAAIYVVDPDNGHTRALPPERIEPYVRDIEKRRQQLLKKKAQTDGP